MPAPAARMRSARLPCGTSSNSILPARYKASKMCESTWRGNEHRILRTRLALSRAASPVSPLPALLLTMVRSFAPCAVSPSISSAGIPAGPKPPIKIVAPSCTSASASATDETVLLIMVVSARVEGSNLRVDVDPYRLGFGVLVHGFEAHLAAVAGAAHAAERRAGIDALVAVDPYHARAHGSSNAVCTREIGGPQPSAQSVFCAVGDGDHLLVVAECRDRDEGAEHLLLRHARARAGPHHRRLDVTAFGQLMTLRCLAAQQNLAAFLARHLHVAQHAVAMLCGRKRAHLGRRVERVAQADRACQSEELIEKSVHDLLVQDQARAGDAGLALI